MRKSHLVVGVAIPIVAVCLTLGSRFAWDRWLAKRPVLDYVRTLDLGERDFGEIAVGRFEIKNSGRAELLLDQLQTTCSCAGVEREVEGKLVRVDSVHLLPGDHAELVARMAVGARPGHGQAVQVFFHTNDPAQPLGTITLIVPRVKGPVYAEPCAVLFGTLPVGGRVGQVINLYDNGVPGRRIDTVRSKHPDRFEARLLPLADQEEPRMHASAGRLIARLEVTARTETAGRLDGEIEVNGEKEVSASAVIPVAGEVLRGVEAQPGILVLPRRVGQRFLYAAQVLLWSPDGRPIHVAKAPALPGFSVFVLPVAGRDDQLGVGRPSFCGPGWRYTYQVTVSSDDLGLGNYREEVVIGAGSGMDAGIRIAVNLSIGNRIRAAPKAVCLKRSPGREELLGRLIVWDSHGEKVELEAIEVGQAPLTWSVSDVAGKKVIVLATKPEKAGQRGSAQIALKVREPRSQAIAVVVRW
jgi:hypothetical protein